MIRLSGSRASLRRVRDHFRQLRGAPGPRLRSLLPSLHRRIAMLGAQWRALAEGPLRPFPVGNLPAPASVGPDLHRQPARIGLRRSVHPARAQDFYCDLARIDVPFGTVRAVHAFVATLPSGLASPTAEKHGEEQIELQWNARDNRYFRAVIGADAMVIYSARLGERGRLDGAEPIGEPLSPIVMHAIRQLGL